MDPYAHDSYVEAQIMSATPQKLRLMMIEGAIRFAKQTIQLWEAKDNERALQSIVRVRNIVSELLSWICNDQSELTNKVAGLYLYVYQTLTTAQLRRDCVLVQEAIAVLEIERETWQRVCEDMTRLGTPGEEQLDADVQHLATPTNGSLDATLLGGSLNFDA